MFWLWFSGSTFVPDPAPSDPAGTTGETGPQPLDGVQATSRNAPSGPARYTFWLWLSASKFVAGALAAIATPGHTAHARATVNVVNRAHIHILVCRGYRSEQ